MINIRSILRFPRVHSAYLMAMIAIMWVGYTSDAWCDGANYIPFKSISISSDHNVQAAAVGDLDGDGNMDILIGASESRSIVWFANNNAAKPSFTRNVVDPDTVYVTSLKILDFDGDGDLDFVSIDNGSNTVAWHENLGTKPPTFTKHIVSTTENQPNDVAVTDLNGDGHLDLVVVASGSNNVVWFESNGARPPSFKHHVILVDLGGAASVETADMNHDGMVDVLVAFPAKNEVVVFYNSDGKIPNTWLMLTGTLWGARKVGVADFDGDGNPDVYAYGYYYTYSYTHSELNWFHNDGAANPSFARKVVFEQTEINGTAVGAADLDQDGHIDLFANNTWYRNSGGNEPTFGAIPTTSGRLGTLLCIARIDADHYPDMVDSSYGVYWDMNLNRKTEDLKPILKSPNPGQVVSLAPRLAITILDFWSHYDDYRLLQTEYQVSKKPEFSNVVYDLDSTGSVNQIFVPSNRLQLNTQYFWRARLLFTDGYTSWSETSSFRTVTRKVVIKNTGVSYPTIQSAIDSAAEGSEIAVPPALYTENVRFRGKNLNLHSDDPLNSATVAATIIDGNWNGSTVIFTGTEGVNCRLAGFTIQHGWGTYGAGVLGNNSHALIERNVITQNTVVHSSKEGQNGGGGISHCNGIIQYNQIIDNAAYAANGAGLYYCKGEIRFNTIARNKQNAAYYGRSLYGGGGLAMCTNVHHNEIADNVAIQYGGGGLYECSPVYANVIRGNKADTGGGLSFCSKVYDNLILGNAATGELGVGGGLRSCGFDGGMICNNTIVGNSAVEGGGAYNCGAALVNCVIWNNHQTTEYYGPLPGCTASYCCIQNGFAGTGNISADPQFVNAAAGDYRLKSNSPCIDAGKRTSSTLDMNYAPRGFLVVGGRDDSSNYDIGSFEYMPGDIVVLKPFGTVRINTGENILVNVWVYTPKVGDAVLVQLVSGSNVVAVLGIANVINGTIKTSFRLPGVNSGSYKIRVISTSQPAISGTSNGSITVTHKNALQDGRWELYR